MLLFPGLRIWNFKTPASMRKTVTALQRVLAFATSFEVFFGAFNTPFFTDSDSVSFHLFLSLIHGPAGLKPSIRAHPRGSNPVNPHMVVGRLEAGFPNAISHSSFHSRRKNRGIRTQDATCHIFRAPPSEPELTSGHRSSPRLAPVKDRKMRLILPSAPVQTAVSDGKT